MAPVKDRVSAWREKIMADTNLKEAYLLKERQRDKVRRKKMMAGLLQDSKKLKQKRARDNARQKKCRDKKKLVAMQQLSQNNKSPLGSYQCSQSLGKAVSRVKKSLPKSPTKQQAVLMKLSSQILPTSQNAETSKCLTQRALSKEQVETVQNFYCRDDISRQAPGKRDTKSVKDSISGKRKIFQKRHMVVTVKEAFQLFTVQENGDCSEKVGISKFYELRPPHVLLSSSLPHNVCVCRYHVNFNFIITAIKKEVPDFHETPAKLLELMSCNITAEKCMTGECNSCKQDVFAIIQPDTNFEKTVTYSQWKEVDGRPKLVEMEASLEGVISQLNGQLPMFKVHYFVNKIQSKFFEEQKKMPNQLVIQVDFAENYEAGYQDEIQSAHWSHSQVTIFTCCSWFDGTVLQSFAIISNDLAHDKHAVYTFLKTILLYIKELFCTKELEVKDLVIFSDGSAAQFKNKFTISNLCYFEDEFGLTPQWHYFATSHGKGAVDGIGGCVKHRVWQEVKSRRANVYTAEEFSECASRVLDKVKIIFVSNAEIETDKEMLSRRWADVQAIKGIQSKHAFRVKSRNQILVGRTSLSEMELHQVIEKKRKLCIDDIFTDSELSTELPEDESTRDDSELTVKPNYRNIKSGTTVRVEFKGKKKIYVYAGICQGIPTIREEEAEQEIQVLFLKKEGKSMRRFIPDERDNKFVFVSQIIEIIPEPKVLNLTDRRVVYEFTRDVHTVC